MPETAHIAPLSQTMNIFVIDAQPVFRLGVKKICETEIDLALVGGGGNDDKVLRRIGALHPDIVLVGSTGGHDGFDVATSIRSTRLAARAILLSGNCTGQQIYDAISSGFSGVACKTEPVEHLLTLLRRSFIQAPALSPRTQHLLQRFIASREMFSRNSNDDELLPALTQREVTVLRAIAEGHSVSEIARELHISESTTKSHRRNIFTKLNVPNASAAVYEAMKRGMLEA